MAQPKKISILPNERVFLAGKTGSGKTYKARRLLLPSKRLIVFDTKDNLSRPDKDKTKEQDKKDWYLTPYSVTALQAKQFRLHVTDMDKADEICSYVLQMTNVVIYIDEAYSVWAGHWNTSDNQYIKRCFTQGREQGVGMWVSCQRPADIPIVVMSECEHFLIFRLQNADDRSKLAKNVHPALERMTTTKHGYYYYNSELEAPIYYPELTEEESKAKHKQEPQEEEEEPDNG